MLSTQPYKGARDFYPENKRVQKWMFSILRKVCESYGYVEYDAPILEPTELYLAKGNEEIINEQTYTFIDRGGRSVTIRTEMTPTVSRMVAARRNELNYPLRWYSIPNLWRYERPQRGRSREFWQLNVDLFGIEDVQADYEIISVANETLRAFGAQESMFTIQVNNRRLTDFLLINYLGLDERDAAAIRRVVDRMNKLPETQFTAMLRDILPSDQKVQELKDILSIKNLDDLPADVKENIVVKDLKKLLSLLKSTGINNVIFDVTLMRGFDYYTGIVFEVTDNDPLNNRAMFGGGRYDGLVSNYGVPAVPTVGFGMGDVTLMNFLETHGLVKQIPSEVQLAILLVGDVLEETLPILKEIRSLGINAEVDFTNRKIEKKIKTAVKDGINFALVIGSEELENGTFKLKNLRESEEILVEIGSLRSEIFGN